MSEPTNTSTEPRPPQPLDTALIITRNGIEKALTVFVGKRNAWKDKVYQAPQIEVSDLDTPGSSDTTFLKDLDFIGKTNVRNALNTIFKRYGQDFYEDSIGEEGTPEAGVFNINRYINYWVELRSSAMKLSELNEAYQEAVDAFQTYSSTTLLEEYGSGDPARMAAAKAKMDQMGATLKAYKADFEERKARRSKEAATETVQPA